MNLARIAISLLCSFAVAPSLVNAASSLAPGLSPSLACELQILAPLPFTYKEHFDVEHRGPAGRTYGPNDRIGDLATGKYLYQIFRNGDVILSPVHDVHGYFLDEHGVWTHANIVMDFVRRHGRTPRGEVMASGELIIAFGEVQRYSNRSGKWKGGEERVDLARRVLLARGLNFTTSSKPVRVGIDPEDEGHTKMARLRDVLAMWRVADVYTHPYGHDRLLDLYERVGRVLGPYTDKRNTHSDSLMSLFRQPRIVGNRRDDLLTFMWPIISACNNDGMAWGIYRVWDNITLGQRNPKNYFNSMGEYFLTNAIVALGEGMTPEDLAELTAVRDGFAALPQWIPPETPPIGPLIEGEDPAPWIASLPVRMPEVVKRPLPPRLRSW